MHFMSMCVYIYILNNLTQYVGMHKLCLNGAHFQICSTAWIENSTVGYPWHMSAGLRHHGRCRCPGAKETPSYQQKPGWFRWGTGIRWIVLCKLGLQPINNVWGNSVVRQPFGFFVIDGFVFGNNALWKHMSCLFPTKSRCYTVISPNRP